MKRESNPDMVFHGKVAPWFWALVAVLVASVAWRVAQGDAVFSVLAAAVLAALWALCCVRNRVELYDDHFDVVFGLRRTSLRYSRIVEVRGARTVLANKAASLDQVEIVLGPDSPVPVRDPAQIVSVRDGAGLVTELRRRAGLSR